MGKFAILCPKCGFTNRASTGLFARKEIACEKCGHQFNTNRARMTEYTCRKCGRSFAYDQAANTVTCPTCHTTETMQEVVSKMVSIPCPTCKCIVDVPKDCQKFFCPFCDHEIDPQKEIARKHLVGNETLSQIEFRDDILAYRHATEDFNCGSQLVVHPSQVAIFVSNGQDLDEFGSGSHILKTENLPYARKQFSVMEDGNVTPFRAEVYFFSLLVHGGIKWGTSSLISFVWPHPQYGDIPLQMGLRGTMALRLTEARKLLRKLVGNKESLTWNSKELSDLYLPWIAQIVPSVVSAMMGNTQQTPNIFSTSHLGAMAENVRVELNKRFFEYGLTIEEFNMEQPYIPEDNENYKLLKEISGQGLRLGKEQGELKISAVEKQTKINVAQGNHADDYALADIEHIHGITGKDVLDADVKKAFASGIGQWGSNAGGGGGGSGADLIGTMIGMKMAGGILQNMEGGSPFAPPAQQAPAAGWTCACGRDGNNGKFCSECGQPKPEVWTCACGKAGNTGRFCSECGQPKPEVWTCACGQSGNNGKFCSACGKPKAANDAWTCAQCGKSGNTGKCCPECGAQKPN